jgi:pyridoxamine 5'-phosphate oxidase
MEKNIVADIRKDYMLKSLLETDVADNPFSQFSQWWDEAVLSEITEVNAMTLATSTSNGFPSARIVLLKGFSQNGFIFFTNYNSAKGKVLAENPRAALIFFWKELERQVRIEGDVSKISAEESDVYFNSRPEGSKIGAWASPQSERIESREVIEQRVTEFTTKFKEEPIQRPPHWGGYAVQPLKVEFWQGRRSRLHDRIQYTLIDDNWSIERLAP